MLVQSFIERLRPLVGIKGWDYIVLWKLSDDNRSIELKDCCCDGRDNNAHELGFEVSSSSPCRDVMYPHPRFKSYDLLDLIPSSMILDSGVHAQTLCSNQPSWLSYSHNSDSTLSSQVVQEAVGTRVLIPLSVGLVELFVADEVAEDKGVMDLIRVQCSIALEQQTMSNSGTTDSFSSALFQQHMSSPDLPNDISIDRIHLSDSMFLEGDHCIFTPTMENAFQEASRGAKWVEEDNRSDDSDENDPKYRRRSGKGSKNLEAERKRRKKLNDRLYALRALVPNISKSAKKTAEEGSFPQIQKRNPKREQESLSTGYHTNKSDQQMEPQVEVYQVDGKEFFVKVFCEHKCGGFVRLIDALYAMGLEVDNVNTMRHTCLASAIFKVERKNEETVEADDVKESLLELTRNPWPNYGVDVEMEITNDVDAINHYCHMNSRHHLH
ncbi:hypothetical protein SASPL_147238 [Salvia splendens]|uniref:BHLH domain-containing protein n=1 Tax=Salvia splendens TaxID=180675 RepID=A0A8X8WDP0_SALSN|nr:hypothetical protein SASPL_147238 [Salvia splendens]